MKNGCNKVEVYYCDTDLFDKDCCFFYTYSDKANCKYKDGARCINPDAQKHADGFGKEYPPPTEPCWQFYRRGRTTGFWPVQVVGFRDGGRLVLYYIYMGEYIRVEDAPGTWGPRIPDWEPEWWNE